MKNGLPIAAIAVALLLGACGSTPTLESKNPVAPTGVNFSGDWRLQTGSSNVSERLREVEREAAGGNEDIVRASKEKKSSRRQKGSAVHVFIRTGRDLKVTQTAHGLFISFDRSVVSEYRFGENRMVNVGPIEAVRVSGWEDDAYVVETLDNDDNKLVERIALRDNGQTLVRQLVIYEDDEVVTSVVQFFDRQ